MQVVTEAYRGELLTVQQVAARLGIHPMTVRKKIAAGEVPAVQLGGKGSAIRVPADELDAWIAERRTESAVGPGSSADHASSAVGTGSCVDTPAERDGTSSRREAVDPAQLAGEA